MGFLHPGEKKQIILERQPGKPGKNFLLVEYIVAPRGYDPRMPFVEGAEIGKVKIRVRAYKDQKIEDKVQTITGQKVTNRGQKFKAPAVIDDEKIEREIAELFTKKNAPQLVPEISEERALGDEEEDEVERKENMEEKKTEQKFPKTLSPPGTLKKQQVVNSAISIGGANTGVELEQKMSKLTETFKSGKDELLQNLIAMMRLLEEREKKMEDKLEKLLADLSFIRILIIVLLVLVPICALLFRH